MNDDKLNEEEQRFNDLYDGIEVDYDELIDEHSKHVNKELNRSVIISILWVVVIVVLVVVGFYFDLYTVS